MKKVLALSTAILLVSMGVVLLSGTTTTVQGASKEVQITDFSDWVSDPLGTGTPVNLTPVGSEVTITANGSKGETWGGLYDDNKTGTAVGMKATIRISNVSAKTGGVQLGFSNSLGLIGNQRIQASIRYEANNYGQSRIIWRIKSKDNTVPGATWSTLAAGTFSDLWYDGYNKRKNITLSFKRVNDDIVFEIIGTPYTVTWTSSEPMTALNHYPEIFAGANAGTNSIKGVIKNVKLLY